MQATQIQKHSLQATKGRRRKSRKSRRPLEKAISKWRYLQNGRLRSAWRLLRWSLYKVIGICHFQTLGLQKENRGVCNATVLWWCWRSVYDIYYKNDNWYFSFYYINQISWVVICFTYMAVQFCHTNRSLCWCDIATNDLCGWQKWTAICDLLSTHLSGQGLISDILSCTYYNCSVCWDAVLSIAQYAAVDSGSIWLQTLLLSFWCIVFVTC